MNSIDGEDVHQPGSRCAGEDGLPGTAGAGFHDLWAEDAEGISQSDCAGGEGKRKDFTQSTVCKT